MAYTSHGHHIPGTQADDKSRPQARCLQFKGCRVCQNDQDHFWDKHPENDLVQPVKKAELSPLDNVMRTYADILQGIYDNRTAGDASFLGVLSEFIEDLTDDGDAFDVVVGRRLKKIFKGN